MQGTRVSKLNVFKQNLLNYKPYFPHLLNRYGVESLLERFNTNSSYSSYSKHKLREKMRNNSSQDYFPKNMDSDDDFDSDKTFGKNTRANQDPPVPIPNRPLRGERRRDHINEDFGFKTKESRQIPKGRYTENKSSSFMRGRPRNDSLEGDDLDDLFIGSGSSRNLVRPNKSSSGRTRKEEDMNHFLRGSQVQQSNNKQTMGADKRVNDANGDGESVRSLFEKFNLSNDDEREHDPLIENQNTPAAPEIVAKAAASLSPEQKEEVEAPANPTPQPPPQDADEIFKKMKETGMIPNAVAMLDGLCKDGLIQEAMKLFGLMREKATIPEVVIYTAVVEGFCKAQKFDDAKRIFKKMQNNGISPNAFSYTVLIQGLLPFTKKKCEGMTSRLEDALDFCVEMLEAGHSPNVITFVSLVEGYVMDKGVGEANSMIGRLREKGFSVNDKAVKEHLDKKGPFSSFVWEAIFGKKISQRPF
ncbi:uncharacterized protein LOC113289706 [Papaver somniferum]|nr:uncharacterized protein LOC113289706 [Papaver somniferum]XP_026394832.1 uncharacterized protein LOC113289706 [Papaver somniferum]XP_026394833.1 uncharacterized protein LOC113289706 [Papaver somniferum]XP_026394834.1 uncharacterized protein LOC113289706 [Papaver somniferum]